MAISLQPVLPEKITLDLAKAAADPTTRQAATLAATHRLFNAIFYHLVSINEARW
jgi:hypothetical protein